MFFDVIQMNKENIDNMKNFNEIAIAMELWMDLFKYHFPTVTLLSNQFISIKQRYSGNNVIIFCYH